MNAIIWLRHSSCIGHRLDQFPKWPTLRIYPYHSAENIERNGSNPDRQKFNRRSRCCMTRGARRSLIPHILEELTKWPTPDCAGALHQLFDRIPEAYELVDSLLFKRGNPSLIHEARIPYHSIHKEFKKLLRDRGFSDNDWPFTSKELWDDLHKGSLVRFSLGFNFMGPIVIETEGHQLPLPLNLTDSQEGPLDEPIE